MVIIGEQRLELNRGFIQYLINSGNIIKISPILDKLIDYDNALHIYNNLPIRSRDDNELEIKTLSMGDALINEITSKYPKIKHGHNTSKQP